MSPEIIGGGHTLAALGLQLTDKNGIAVVTGDEQALFRQRDERTWGFLRFLIGIFHAVNFKFRAAKLRRGDGPRDKAAHVVDK